MKMKRYEEDKLKRVIEADEEQPSLDEGSDDSVSKDDSDGQDGDAAEAVTPTDQASYKIKLIDNDDDTINYSFKKDDEASFLTVNNQPV